MRYGTSMQKSHSIVNLSVQQQKANGVLQHHHYLPVSFNFLHLVNVSSETKIVFLLFYPPVCFHGLHYSPVLYMCKIMYIYSYLIISLAVK